MRRLGVVAFAAAVGLCPGLQTTRAPAPPAQTRRRTNTPPKNGNGVPIATTSLGANANDDDWWTPFLVRPGQDEAYAILSDFQRGEAADDAFDHAVHGAKFLDDPESGAFPTRRAVLSNVLEGEVSSSWWGAILEAFDKTQSSESELFDAAWQRVRADLGPAGADAAGDVSRKAHAATKLLHTWASMTSTPAEAKLVLARGARIAAYIARTPFGGDADMVAAALLCEAHEALDGLRLEEIRASVGPEAAGLVRCLNNLSQLYRLQRARWDAEGDELWRCDQDVRHDFADDELLYTCRLPSSHAKNLRQMLVAVAGDFRALPLLLVRHLEKLHEECGSAAAAREASLLEAASEHIKATVPNVKPSTRARDALDVLAPLADRFGLNQLKNDLEDAAFERLAPATRSQILKALDRKRDDRSVVRGDVSARLRRLMVEDDVLMNAVESLRVSTREKEPYSVWRKQRKLRARAEANVEVDGFSTVVDPSGDEVLYPLDTIALRIVLDPTALAPDASAAAKATRVAAGEALCYHALNLVQAAWQPLQNRTKDYVARPKANGYQSLHTTVLMRLHGASYPFEVQIRTRDMHLVAEFGSAAHALYSGARPAPVPVAPPPPVEEEAAVEVPGEPLEGEAESSAIGARLGKSMGDRLRAERIFVLASGGRVLTVGANDNAVDVRKALLRDLEHDAADGALVTGGGLWLDDERARGHLEINGKRLEWLQSLSTKLLNGDEVRWVEDPEAAHGELEETPRP